jgi:predicted metal-dependent hydrolase
MAATTEHKPTESSTHSSRPVPTRRISFDQSFDDLPKYFAADGDLVMSHVIVALSSVFPDGEDFFVRSVRQFRDQVSDPELKRQVGGFIGQEAVHGREHRALNNRFAELGYGSKQAERVTRWGLAAREKFMSKKSNLAATAALEHYTATLAEVLLSEEGAREMVDSPEIADLFGWHALEECEHKAVAFDVYKDVGGSERTRVFTMNMITAGFVGGMTLQVILSVLTDRNTYRGGNLRRSLRRLRTSPFLTKDVWRQLRDYNRPDFHPDDRNTDDLLAQWRDEMFGDAGTLNDKLKTAA